MPRLRVAWVLVLGLALGPRSASASEDAVGRGELIMIDPGHGGANLGSPGRGELFEKQLTLQVARRLERLLLSHGYRVALTRRDDRYLTLRERVRRSNSLGPAIFLSLHANASPDHSQRGVETFVLDLPVAEVEARRLARRALGKGPVEALLADLRAAQQLRESMRLGRAMQESLIALRGAVDRGLRQADYDVLAGLRAPAVLIEMGFLDHVIEGPALCLPATQEQIVQALFEGIHRFLEEGGPPAVTPTGQPEPAPAPDRARRKGASLSLADRGERRGH